MPLNSGAQERAEQRGVLHYRRSPASESSRTTTVLQRGASRGAAAQQLLPCAMGISLAMAVLASAMCAGASAATPYPPLAYYRFEVADEPWLDAALRCNLSIPTGPTVAVPTYTASGGTVGAFLDFNAGGAHRNASVPVAWGAQSCANVTAAGAPGLTLEFLLRPTAGCFARGGSATLFKSSGSSGTSVLVELTSQSLTWTATTAASSSADGDASPTDTLSASLEGAGVLAADYLWGGGTKSAWHHFAFVKDAASGNMSVWVDGRNPAELRAGGTATGRVMEGGALAIDARDPVALCAGLDEVAVWGSALPPSLIYQHYTDAIVKHVPYSLEDPGTPPPPGPAYPNATNSSYYDLEEYAPGSQLPSAPGNNTAGATMSCVDQLTFAPAPRFNMSSISKYKTPYNFNWMDPGYMAGRGQPTGRSTLENVTLAIQQVLSSRWRYGFAVHVAGEPSGYAWSLNQTIALANANDELPVHVLINRREVRPGGTQLYNQSLPKGCWAQDADGNFIEVTGAKVPAGAKKTLRPMSAKMAEAVGCPDSLFNADGPYFRDTMFAPLGTVLKRPVNIVNTDGEIFISLMTPAETWDFSADPAVYKDYNASGASDWETYFSQWRLRLTNGWSNVFMADSQLSKPGAVLSKSEAKFTMYQVQGTNPYFGNWEVTRQIGTPMPDAATHNDTYYSTMDFYLQHPREWWGGGGPDHGVAWMIGTRASEMSVGDLLMSPFVAAGWSGQSERNVRPAQWLSLMKILAAYGTEWFYSGFFSLGQPFPPSQNWCWQGMVPVYAQALMTQWADWLYEGHLVAGDDNTTFVMGGTSSPLLWVGAPNVLCLVRQLGNEPVFLVTLGVQRNSNAKLNLIAPSTTVYVPLPGVSEPVKLTARLQGSVYVWRNDTGTSTPTVYQLDGWHEASHPLWWRQDTLLEAELLDGHAGLPHARAIRTELGEDATGALDFVGSRAHVSLGALPPGAVATYHVSDTRPLRSLAVRVRSAGLGRLVVECGGRTPSEMLVKSTDGWRWLMLPASRCGSKPAAGGDRDVTVSLSGSVDVDKLEFAWMAGQ